jgi:hypothetical protein
MPKSRDAIRLASAMLGIGIVLVLSGCAGPPAPPPLELSGQPCPQWLLFPTNHHSNAESPYLGCVSDANLRAMVEDSADLDVGRQLGPADGDRETRAIESYQQGKVSSFQGSGSMAPPTSSAAAGGGGTQ